MKNRFALLSFLVLFSARTFAQNTFEFLRLEQSPRAAALGGAYVGVADDPNAIFYNPAGIFNIKNTPVSFSFLKHLLDINSVSLASAFTIEGLGNFASSIQYTNYGNFDELDESRNKLGSFNPSDLVLTVAYGNSFNENFTYGMGIKFIYSGIADYSSMGIAGDFGVQYLLPNKGWTFGFSVLNFGSQITTYDGYSETLPNSIQIGATKKLSHMPLQLFFALTRLNDTDRFKFFNVGAEFSLSKTIVLRFGYDNKKRDDYKIASSAGLGGFSFGFGINIKGYNFDYAFNSLGDIGAMHRIGISTTFY